MRPARGEDLLALFVELGALAVHRSDLGCAMLRKRGWWLALLPSAVKRFETTGDDAQSIFVEKGRARNVRRLGRHRVRQALEHHFGGRANEDRDM